jgi:hypothetical protein
VLLLEPEQKGDGPAYNLEHEGTVISVTGSNPRSQPVLGKIWGHLPLNRQFPVPVRYHLCQLGTLQRGFLDVSPIANAISISESEPEIGVGSLDGRPLHNPILASGRLHPYRCFRVFFCAQSEAAFKLGRVLGQTSDSQAQAEAAYLSCTEEGQRYSAARTG